SFGKDDAFRTRQRMAMADPAAAENDWIGMGDVPNPAAHACESLPPSRHRSQTRGRSTGPCAGRESRRLYRGGAGDPATRRRGPGSVPGETVHIHAINRDRLFQERQNSVNDILIPCPKHRAPAMLDWEHSFDALIGWKNIADMLHASAQENR